MTTQILDGIKGEAGTMSAAAIPDAHRLLVAVVSLTFLVLAAAMILVRRLVRAL